jgi:hypothetical protein
MSKRKGNRNSGRANSIILHRFNSDRVINANPPSSGRSLFAAELNTFGCALKIVDGLFEKHTKLAASAPLRHVELNTGDTTDVPGEHSIELAHRCFAPSVATAIDSGKPASIKEASPRPFLPANCVARPRRIRVQAGD